MFKKLATYMCMFLVGVTGFLGGGESLIQNIKPSIEILSIYAACDDIGQPPCAESEPVGQQANSNAKTQEMLQNLVSALNIVLAALTIIVSPAIILAGWLMSPDWTSGDIFGIRPMIHSLWIMVSNVTYFIYAILLVFIALATIFNSDKYGYKQLLPKLALGIILVPLTWWFIQFTISLSSIVTASVISLPEEVMNSYGSTLGNGANQWWITPLIPKDITYQNDTNLSQRVKYSCAPDVGSAGPGQVACISPKDMLAAGGGIYSPLLIYAYGIFNFQSVFNINSTTDVVKAITQIIHQGIIGAIMFFVFGLLVLALIFMLMMRAIKLWFYAIFSPIMTLKYVIGDGMFGSKDNSGSFDLKEFIGLAFVPALVGLALSFGLIIVAAMKMSTGTDGSLGGPQGNCLRTANGCTITMFGNTQNSITSKILPGTPETTQTIIKFAGITYTYNGSVSGATGDAVAGAQSILSSAGGIFGTIIIDIIALIFVWTAFMAAKNVSKAVSAAIQPFEEMGSNMAKLGTSLPKYMPIPGTGGMSVSSMTKVPNLVGEGFRVRNDERFEQSEVGGKLKQWAGATTSAEAAKYRQALDQTGKTSADMMRNAIIDGIRNGHTENIGKDKYMEGFSEKIKKGDVQHDDLVRAGVDRQVAQKMVERSKTDKPLAEDEKLIYAAWIAGNTDTGLTGEGAKRWLKDKANANNSGAGSTGSNTGAPVVGVVSKNENSTLANAKIIQITGTGVTYNLEADKKITNIGNLEGLKTKKNIIKEVDFTQQLKNQGMSDDAAKLMVEAIKKTAPEFFIKP